MLNLLTSRQKEGNEREYVIIIEIIIHGKCKSAKDKV